MKLLCFERHDYSSNARDAADGIWCSADEDGWHKWGKWGGTDFEVTLCDKFLQKADGMVPYERTFQEQRRSCETCGYTQSAPIVFQAP